MTFTKVITKVITKGLWGFASFFTAILIINTILFVTNYSKTFNVDAIDVFHSFIGFFLFIISSYSKYIIKQDER